MQISSSKRRPRRSPKEWADIVRRSEITDLSLTQFGRLEGVSLPSLYAWRKKLRNATPAFSRIAVPDVVSSSNREQATALVEPSSGFEIRLRSGDVVCVPPGKVDVAQLRCILAALGGAR